VASLAATPAARIEQTLLSLDSGDPGTGAHRGIVRPKHKGADRMSTRTIPVRIGNMEVLVEAETEAAYNAKPA